MGRLLRARDGLSGVGRAGCVLGMPGPMSWERRALLAEAPPRRAHLCVSLAPVPGLLAVPSQDRDCLPLHQGPAVVDGQPWLLKRRPPGLLRSFPAS